MSFLEHNALQEYYESLENSISNHLKSIANELVKLSTTSILTTEQRREILDFPDKRKGAKRLLEIVIQDVEQAENSFIFDTLLDVLYAKGNRAMKDLVTNIKSYCHEEYRKKLPESSNSPGDECDVFINYGRGSETNQFVDDLESSLKGRHLKVFVDRTGISPGKIWSQTIANALHSCKAFVAVLTKKYVKSLYCRCELFQAVHGNKTIFPAVRESGWNQEPSGKSVADVVGSIQYAFVQDGEEHETQLRELIESISSHCQRESVKTPKSKIPTPVGDSALIKPDDRPKMTELRRLKLQNGDTIDLVIKIGTSYPEFGIHILRDIDLIDIIKEDCHYKPNCIVEEILGYWLKGKGRHPVTWTTFVECLRESKLEEVAMDVERQFID